MTKIQDIANGVYRVVIVSPEKILHDPHFHDLWRDPKFLAMVMGVSCDEGHCISQWGDTFRPEYGQLGRLRWILPSHIRFHVVSATMPQKVLQDIKERLFMRNETTTVVRMSNDRPNIHLAVEKMQYPLHTARDLLRVLQLKDGQPPRKFMAFVNRRRDAEDCVDRLWELAPELKEKVTYFHSGMSPEFRKDRIQKLRSGELWGIICTDAAGMVSYS